MSSIRTSVPGTLSLVQTSPFSPIVLRYQSHQPRPSLLMPLICVLQYFSTYIRIDLWTSKRVGYYFVWAFRISDLWYVHFSIFTQNYVFDTYPCRIMKIRHVFCLAQVIYSLCSIFFNLWSVHNYAHPINTFLWRVSTISACVSMCVCTHIRSGGSDL